MQEQKKRSVVTIAALISHLDRLIVSYRICCGRLYLSSYPVHGLNL
jgi:hypothetical protein